MRLRGPIITRLTCSAAFATSGFLVTIEAIRRLNPTESVRPLPSLLLGGAAVFMFGSASRALASRVEVDLLGVVTHTLFSSRSHPWQAISGFVIGRFNGWDVATMELKSGRSVRLPLLAQPSGREAMEQMIRELEDQLHTSQT